MSSIRGKLSSEASALLQELAKGIEDEEFFRKEAEKSLRRIHTFAEKRKLQEQAFSYGGKRALLLIDPGSSGPAHERIGTYLQEHIHASEGVIVYNCYLVAEKACAEAKLTGRIHTPNGTTRFVGLGSHCVNYDALPDGSVVSVDLTASEFTKLAGKTVDVLMLHAKDLPELLQAVGALYGGKWSVIPNTDEEWISDLRAQEKNML